MIIAALSSVGFAEGDPVSYIERTWDGTKIVETEKAADAYTPVDSGTTAFTDGGTYVVTGKVSVTSRIECGKDVKLIICDGATLTAAGGIHVPDAGSIAIFGGFEDSGKLNAYCSSDSGIGGNRSEIGGSITVNGGRLETSSDLSGCIQGTVTVNGGEISADANGGAGIGGADKGSCGDITINGGYIIAESYSGAGIGSGDKGKCGAVTINGGRLVASSSYGAGIGSGVAGSCGTVSINGGMITDIADAGSVFRGAAAFKEKAGAMPDIRIGKGVVLFYGKDSAECGSYNYYVTEKTKDIKKKLGEAKIFAVNPISYVERTVNSDFSITETERVSYCTRLISEDATVLSSDGLDTYYIAGGMELKSRVEIKGDVKLILSWGSYLRAPKGISVTEGNSLTIYAEASDTGAIIASYGDDIDAAAIGGSMSENSGVITIHGGTVTADGYRCAGIGAGQGTKGHVEILGGNINCRSLGCGGISSFVTIRGGKVVSSSDIGAGIGAGVNAFGDEILITGGTVTASSKQGAGIGNGMRPKNWIMTNGGKIGIYGGTVTATSETGSAIGGGENCEPAEVTLGDGVVLRCGDSAEGSLSTVDGGKDSPAELGKKLSEARYAEAESADKTDAGSVFSDGSLAVIMVCAAVIVCAAVTLIIWNKKRTA